VSAEWDEYVEAVLAVVESIPSGRVLAYGQVAAAVGSGGPRQVGRVLSEHGGGVPWWRVVTSAGRTPPGHERVALEHLRAEGTPLRGAHVDMRRATAAFAPGVVAQRPARSPYDPPADWPHPPAPRRS